MSKQNKLHFDSTNAIQDYLAREHRLHVSAQFIQTWVKENKMSVRKGWYLENLLIMGRAGDAETRRKDREWYGDEEFVQPTDYPKSSRINR